MKIIKFKEYIENIQKIYTKFKNMKIDFSMSNHSKLLPFFGFRRSTHWNRKINYVS